MLAVFVMIGGIWLSRWILPAVVLLSLWNGDWWQACALLGLWLFVVWVYRRFRLNRFLEGPRSLL